MSASSIERLRHMMPLQRPGNARSVARTIQFQASSLVIDQCWSLRA
jgi:hypothetical protein